MDEQNVSLNEGQESVVDSQIEQNTEPVQAESVEVAEPQQEQQTPEQNALFAKVRRETEQKAKDAVIAEMYGSQGIHTYTDYQKALKDHQRQQEAQQKGIDPELYSQLQTMQDELNSYKREKTMLQQEVELAKDPVKGELYNSWKDDVQAIANNFNVDLKTAFTLVLEEKLPDILGKAKAQTEQETIKKINANAQSTPGALSSESIPKANIWDMNSSDFNKMIEKAKRGELRNI